MTRAKPMTATRVPLSRWRRVSRAKLVNALHDLEEQREAHRIDAASLATRLASQERTARELAEQIDDLKGQLKDYQRAAANERERGHFAVVEAYQKALRIVASKGQD